MAHRGCEQHNEDGTKDVFVGTHERTLDDKGRLALPVAFRAQLGERGFLVDLGTCLAVYTEAGFREAVDRLNAEVRDGGADQDAVRLIASSAHEVSPDSQGRIVLPAGHRNAAALENEATVIGAINRVEIWNPTGWEELKARDTGDGPAKGKWL